MLQVKIYNIKGEVVGKQKLEPSVFDIEVKPGLIHRALVAQLSQVRRPIAFTKTRAEVRGGGRKPWQQKGTGRARAGSIRSPLWRKGGVIFGPRLRQFKKKINVKEKRKALLMTLTSKVRENSLKLLDQLKLEKAKTKEMAKILQKLIPTGTVLVVLSEADPKVIRSLRNLAGVGWLLARNVNIYDLLRYDFVLMPKGALAVIEKIYRSK